MGTPFPVERHLAEQQATIESKGVGGAPWQDGVFDSASGSTAVLIPANGILWVFGFSSTGTGYNLEAEYRAGGTKTEFPVNTDGADPIPFDGRVYRHVKQTAGPNAASWVIWPRDLGGVGPRSGINTVRLQTSPISKIEAQSDATEADFVTVAPASIASATGETVEATGAANSVAGGYMNIVLSMEGVIATAADVFVYIAVKGATSGRYYAVCFAPGVVSVRMDTPFTPEKMNIVARNQDTVAHGMAAAIELAAP